MLWGLSCKHAQKSEVLCPRALCEFCQQSQCAGVPRWALVFMASGDRFRMDALSGREAEWCPAFHCQFSPWHRLTGFAPVFKGQQMQSERFWFRGCRNNTETGLCELRAGVPVRDPTGNLMKAKRMHTGTSLGSVLEVSETPRSPSLDARWKDPYFRGSAREPTSGAAERKMTLLFSKEKHELRLPDTVSGWGKRNRSAFCC